MKKRGGRFGEMLLKVVRFFNQSKDLGCLLIYSSHRFFRPGGFGGEGPRTAEGLLELQAALANLCLEDEGWELRLGTKKLQNKTRL